MRHGKVTQGDGWVAQSPPLIRSKSRNNPTQWTRKPSGMHCRHLLVPSGSSSCREKIGHPLFESLRKAGPHARARAPSWDFERLQLAEMATKARQSARSRGLDRKPAEGWPRCSIGCGYGSSGRELSALSWETAAGRRGCRAPSADPLARKPARHARLDRSSCRRCSRSPWPAAARPLG